MIRYVGDVMKGKFVKNNKAFTLIELIVVIAIIGIILILALPQVGKIQEANKNRKYEVYEMSIERGAKLYVDSRARDLFGNNKFERLMMITVMMLRLYVGKEGRQVKLFIKRRLMIVLLVLLILIQHLLQ